MKRLLISSLMGCMLMSQVNAGDFKSLVTQDNAVALAKGAGIAMFPLVVRGAMVAKDAYLVERQHKKGMPSLFWYALPSVSVRDRVQSVDECFGLSSMELEERLKSEVCPVNIADNRNINWNRIAAIFSTLFLGASVAKLYGWQGMPAFANSLFDSKLTAIGMATGSVASLALLARNLTKPTFTK